MKRMLSCFALILLALTLVVSSAHAADTSMREIGVFELRCFDAQGQLLWSEDARNNLADGGEQLFLDVTLRAGTAPTNYYIALYNDTPTETDTLAQSAASLTELAGLVESIGSTVQSIVAVTDQQLFVENVAIMAQSSASLAAIGSYIAQVQTTAVSQASLVDVLVGAFVGKYIFQDIVRPRLFHNLVAPRTFADTARPRSFFNFCSPRGRA